MGRFVLFGCLSALASQALANTPLLEEFGISPVFPPHGSIDRRAIDDSCFTSVVSKLSPPEPSNTELQDWAATETEAISACTITAPASLSDEVISYLDEFTTWLATVESVADSIDTKCGADIFTFSVSMSCTESHTVVFTEEASGTGTPGVVSSTVMEPMDAPTGTMYIGDGDSAAARNGGMSKVALVVAGVLGAVMAF
ncbi:hypothetical protein BGZ61DRAFT_459203 [Ilyonectria robusta]|uniref:uncharacterized protein n=1 Tax=Ilyonectria robusta TaxID=1079257 RepID=UPI001E8E3BA2|nr:uncharacterized protein BGZ61DRAFT_459203 [Ilyonectria robusta]KAH8672367.1 hypothetical protein BGZ61DRAFT_459203 [Ilyonectria robusta]